MIHCVLEKTFGRMGISDDLRLLLQIMKKLNKNNIGNAAETSPKKSSVVIPKACDLVSEIGSRKMHMVFSNVNNNNIEW